MEHFNIEIKARCSNPNFVRKLLRQRKAEFLGVDHQIDTYFRMPAGNGRLKLREGDIENELIYYKRNNKKGPKKSDFMTVDQPGKDMKTLLDSVLGTAVVVDKRREIYYIKNVKFHLDQVKGLGEFIEIEAYNKSRNKGNGNGNGGISKGVLLKQVNEYMKTFGIKKMDLLPNSYSDMLGKKKR